MKLIKKLSIALSTLLTANLLYTGGIHVRAAAVSDSIIKISKVSVNKELITTDQIAQLTVEATSSAGDMGNEASVVYVVNTGSTETEKEITLTLNNGKYTANLDSLTSGLSGECKISFITLSDKAGNHQIFYNSNVHSNLGQDLSLGNVRVISDIEGPIFTKISLSDKNVFLGSDLKISLEAKDNGIGLSDEANLVYTAKSQQGDVEIPVSLQLVNGKYEGSINLGSSYPLGDWKISFITLSDKAGNVTITYNNWVHQNLGVDLSYGDFKLIEDTSGPQIGSISIDKSIAKAGTAVNITVVGSDRSGLADQAQLSYILNDGNVEIEKYVDLTFKNGRYEGQFIIDDSYLSGLWKINYVTMQDMLGNLTVLYNSNVHGNIGVDLSSGNLKVDLINPDKPVITLSTEAFTNKNVQVTISSPEANTSIEYKLGADLNWLAYTTPFAVSENTTITARVIDAAGNVSESTVKYVTNIDRKAPVITVNGVEDKVAYNKDITVEVKFDDETATVTKSLTLDGKPVEIGKLDKDGSYVLKVSAVDAAGNTSSLEYNFIIDKVAPSITVEGVEDGKTYTNTSVTPTIKIGEGVEPTTLTLDGKDYDGKTVIKSVGTHVLVVKASDKAGNKSEKTVTFTINAVLTTNTDSVVNTIKDLVTNTNPSEKVVVNASESQVVDAKVFEAVKGIDRPISIVVDTQGMKLTYTFNGKEVTNTTTSVDLTLNTVAPSKDIILKAEPNAQIFSFKNHGTLPAPMVVTIPVDTTKFDVTKPLYFYYYNETTKKAELVSDNLMAYKVGDKYFVDVTLTHNSDFFLSASDNTTVTKSVEKLVQTGSSVDMNVLLMIGMTFIAVGSLFFIRRRRLQ